MTKGQRFIKILYIFYFIGAIWAAFYSIINPEDEAWEAIPLMLIVTLITAIIQYIIYGVFNPLAFFKNKEKE